MASDDDIKALQEALDICGCSPGRHDGKMGPTTRSAIREFQKKAGIGVDGSVGPETRQALRNPSEQRKGCPRIIVSQTTLKQYWRCRLPWKATHRTAVRHITWEISGTRTSAMRKRLNAGNGHAN